MILGLIYSVWLTFKATGRIYPVRFFFSNGLMPVRIHRSSNGKIVIRDKVIITSWSGGDAPINIRVGKNAVLEIENEFVIGQGTLLLAATGSKLTIKGKLNSTGSGVTCDTKIMAEQSIEIGHDCIIAWGCCITDSNWHDFADTERILPVRIGDRVWLGHDVTVLAGANVGDGCVVGAKSLLLGKTYKPSTLLVGVPARVVRENVTWSR
jgi:acetyltransferase-like isoleucine patch superfamily enzyme